MRMRRDERGRGRGSEGEGRARARAWPSSREKREEQLGKKGLPPISLCFGPCLAMFLISTNANAKHRPF
eukprot:scaffold84712_cov31-Tisochrysis_lutea.AAC.1